MIEVTYRFPARVDAVKQARVIAVGQTAGSWGARFATREARLRAHLGRVLDVSPAEGGESLARIGYPEDNVEGDIPTLLTMIFGKYSLTGPARIVDLTLPEGYGTRPRLGIAGLRHLTGVADRPLFMGIFKPALGLSAADHAALLEQVAPEGLDIIKDDEILGNLPYAPALERVRACRPVIEAARTATGRELLYAVNLTGRADRLNANARQLIEAGANALLFNVFSYGFSALEALAADPHIPVPIFTHPALAGAIGGATDDSGEYGIAYPVLLGTLMRHAGADAVLHPAHYGSLPFSRDTEFAIRDILRAPRGDLPRVMPVPSAGMHPGVVGRVRRDYGDDVVINAGTAIFDHPLGPTQGIRAFFQALALTREGLSVTSDNCRDEALGAALEKWGDE